MLFRSINAIAGGGTLITFPALVAAGYSAKTSSVTNTVAIWPGTIGSSWAYRAELAGQQRTITDLALPTITGAIAGSALLLATPESTFKLLVPFLIFGACILLALQDRITVFALTTDAIEPSPRNLLFMRIALLLTAIYGGYFGAGIGIITLAIFGLFLPQEIQIRSEERRVGKECRL